MHEMIHVVRSLKTENPSNVSRIEKKGSDDSFERNEIKLYDFAIYLTEENK